MLKAIEAPVTQLKIQNVRSNLPALVGEDADERRKTELRPIRSHLLMEGEEWKELYKDAAPTIINASILNSRFEMLVEFSERGVSLNTQDFQKWSPAHCAVFKNDTACLKFLLDHKINVDQRDDEGRTPVLLGI